MTDKVLFVDDDRNVLNAYVRQLRKGFDVRTALGGKTALADIDSEGPFSVVVADMQMPGMNGAEFLSRVKQVAPDTVRVMLTGNVDQKTAVEAVNEGSIFRFLNKPCPAGLLRRTVEDALRQYKLVTAERQLLEETLGGAIRVLTEILSSIDPYSFELTESVRDAVESLIEEHDVERGWELKVASMLSQIGSVTLPSSVLVKAREGRPPSQEEEVMVRRIPEIGATLLRKIPRLEAVARIVLYQEKRFDGTGFPDDDLAGEEIPWGSRVLKGVSDLVRLQTAGMSRSEALRTLRGRRGWYDPDILELLATVTHHEVAVSLGVRAVAVEGLQAGDTLASPVETVDGKPLISAGHRVSGTILERIRNFHKVTGIKEPIHVEVPKQDGDS